MERAELQWHDINNTKRRTSVSELGCPNVCPLLHRAVLYLKNNHKMVSSWVTIFLTIRQTSHKTHTVYPKTLVPKETSCFVLVCLKSPPVILINISWLGMWEKHSIFQDSSAPQHLLTGLLLTPNSLHFLGFPFLGKSRQQRLLGNHRGGNLPFWFPSSKDKHQSRVRTTQTLHQA